MLTGTVATAPVKTAEPGWQLQVQLDDARRCRQCAAGRGCGAMSFSSADNTVFIRCNSPSPAFSTGDRVTVSVSCRQGLWIEAVLLAYGMPTVGLLAGAALGRGLLASLPMAEAAAARSGIAASELATLAGAVVGLLAGLWLVPWGLNRWQVHSGRGRDMARALATAVVRPVDCNTEGQNSSDDSPLQQQTPGERH